MLAVVTDRRLPSDNDTKFYWQAEVVQVNEYYVFGGKMPNRCWEAAPEPGAESENYRYGFNGKEEDTEVSFGIYAFEARMYDGRLGRFFSRDPREAEYAWQSTYAYFRNCPTTVLDYLGMGGESTQPVEEKTELQTLISQLDHFSYELIIEFSEYDYLGHFSKEDYNGKTRSISEVYQKADGIPGIHPGYPAPGSYTTPYSHVRTDVIRSEIGSITLTVHVYKIGGTWQFVTSNGGVSSGCEDQLGNHNFFAKVYPHSPGIQTLNSSNTYAYASARFVMSSEEDELVAAIALPWGTGLEKTVLGGQTSVGHAQISAYFAISDADQTMPTVTYQLEAIGYNEKLVDGPEGSKARIKSSVPSRGSFWIFPSKVVEGTPLRPDWIDSTLSRAEIKHRVHWSIPVK